MAFVELPTYAIFVSLTIELHKNNIETPLELLTNGTILLSNITDLFQGICSGQFFFSSQM